MSRNWIRDCHIIVTGGSGGIDLSNMRIRFKIKQWTTQHPNLADIRVTNLSDQTAKTVMQEFTHVQVIAGYVGNSGLIFDGTIKQARKGRESATDTFLDIFAADGDPAYNFAKTMHVFPPGSKPQDHYDQALKDMSEFGITKGYTPDLSKPTYPRSYTVSGMTRDLLRVMAHTVKATWSIQYGKLEVVPVDGSVTGSVVVLNSNTGMIGMPVQTMQGIIVRCLINPAIYVNSIIQIDQASIIPGQFDLNTPSGNPDISQGLMPPIDADGQYRVLMIEKTGDTRGTPWYYDCWCVSAGTPDSMVPEALIQYLAPSG